MGNRCNCIQARKDNPDKTFEELIKEGLICETCASNYYEFSKLIEEESSNPL